MVYEGKERFSRLRLKNTRKFSSRPVESSRPLSMLVFPPSSQRKCKTNVCFSYNQCVENYLHGAGEAQEALRAATRGGRGGRGTRGARGARGGRGTGGRGRGGGGVVAPRGDRDDDNDDDDDDDDDQGPPRGGVRERARGAATTRGRGTSTARGRAGAAGAGTAAGRRAGSPTFGKSPSSPHCQNLTKLELIDLFGRRG